MKLTLGDREYVADILSLYRLTIREAREIKRNTGLTFASWRFGLITLTSQEDPDVLLGMLYVLKSRAGETVDWDDLNSANAQELIDGLELTLTQVDENAVDPVIRPPR